MQKTFLKQACTCNQKNTFDDNLLRIEAGGDYHPRLPPDPSSFSCENLKNLKIRSEQYVLLALILFQMYWNEFELFLSEFEVQLWSSKCKTSFDQYFYSMLRSALSIPFMSPLGYKLLRLEAPPVTSPLVYQPLCL